MTTRFIIQSIHQETSDTYSFVLEFDKPITYQPGQFLTVKRKNGLHEIRRQYSFSSHPHLDKNPVITVKRIPNGELSRWLVDEAKPGDALETIGASGLFTLPSSTNSMDTVILLAAGSGITPIYPLLREVLYFQPHLRVVLIYSNHSVKETIFYNELNTLRQQYPALFTLEYFFSDNKDLRKARLGKVLLVELLEQYVTRPSKTLAYFCGPYDYRKMVNIPLQTRGLSPENIYKEVFHSPEPARRPEPPDKDTHHVSIFYENNRMEFEVTYPQTILQAALQNGIMLPYSCEAGRCGTCAATCTKGSVWMQRNEVLLDKEVARGRVLTCTGYPVGGDVELVIE
jgi:ferredoxin-NADP reductase